jgi:hypothetical protein
MGGPGKRQWGLSLLVGIAVSTFAYSKIAVLLSCTKIVTFKLKSGPNKRLSVGTVTRDVS